MCLFQAQPCLFDPLAYSTELLQCAQLEAQRELEVPCLTVVFFIVFIVCSLFVVIFYSSPLMLFL